MTTEVIVIDDDDEPSYEAPLKKMRFSDNTTHTISEGLPNYDDFDYMGFFGDGSSSPEAPTNEEPTTSTNNPDMVEIIVIDEDEAQFADEVQLVDTVDNSILIKEKSQIQKSKRTYECSICMDDMNHEDIFVLFNCMHNKSCRLCLIQYIKDSISARQIPIKCPIPSCKEMIAIRDLSKLLSTEEYTFYESLLLQKTLEEDPNEYGHCLTPNCEYMFMKEPGDTYFECLKCRKKYCLECQVEWHAGISCEKYKKWAAENNQADQLFDKYKNESKGKDCPKCKRYIEKTKGCDHMRCRCGTEFCYSCGMIRAPHCPCDVKKRREVENDGRLARAMVNREQELVRMILQRRLREREEDRPVRVVHPVLGQQPNNVQLPPRILRAVPPLDPFEQFILQQAPPVVEQHQLPPRRTFTQLLFEGAFGEPSRPVRQQPNVPAPVFLDDPRNNAAFDLSEFMF